MSDAARVDEAMDGNVLILTINYPQRKNAIAPAVRAALEDAIERAHLDKAVRAIVITGAGWGWRRPSRSSSPRKWSASAVRAPMTTASSWSGRC